jgi:hypothetical protein
MNKIIGLSGDEMINVVNGYKDGFIGENKIYIGRYNDKLKLKSSPLCNPYWISNHRLRDEAIALYKALLWESIKRYRDKGIIDGMMEELIRIANLDNDDIELTCYCKPERCHGDVIISAIQWLKTQEWFLNDLF